MTKGKKLTDVQYAQIIIRYNQKESMKNIAKNVNCSKTTVWETIQRFKKTGNCFIDKKKVERKKLLTVKDEAYIKLLSKRDRRKTVPEITKDLNFGRQEQVSISTVRRSLTQIGMKGRVAVKKPLLRKENIRKRLAWCVEHQNWTPAQWRNVLWTDESKFELFGNKRNIYVRREKHERYHKNCIVPTMKHGGGSVMIWGGMSSSGVVPLYRINGIMNKEKYHSMLVHQVIPGGLKLLGHGFTLQQDNDPKHTANVNKKYLEKKEKEGNNY